MAKFLNKKEQVFDMRLTPYGKYLLSVGSFKPVYYAFYDSNIIYDKRYTSASGPTGMDIPIESQNVIDDRIKNQTVYLEPFVSFTSPEYSEEILYEDDQYMTDISPTRLQPAPDVFKYVNAIGDANLMADSSDAAPAWKLVCLEGEFGTVDPIDVVNETKIPQIDVDIIYVKTVVDVGHTNDPKNAMDILGVVGPFSDNNYIQIQAQNFLIYGEEVNTQLLMENFDVEIFEITENTGVKATGVITVAQVPANGNTITISDGYRAVTFEWVTTSGAGSAANTEVLIESTGLYNVVNGRRLTAAINSSILDIDAEFDWTNYSYPAAVLTNQRIGVRANVDFVGTIGGSWYDGVETVGMHNGQDGTDVMRQKYFDTIVPQVVDGFMVRGQPVGATATTAPLLSDSTSSVSYYFDYYRDDENDRHKICKALEYYNKETYYINVEMDCTFDDAENIYYDIYGSAVEPELCQD